MNSTKLILASLALAAAQNQRYIITYDLAAWNAYALSHLPSKTIEIMKDLRMQIAELTPEEITELGALKGVTLEKVQNAELIPVMPSMKNAPPTKNWGLDRINQRKGGLDNNHHTEVLGEGVDVWVIDSGIDIDHEEFIGRATFKNFAGDGVDKDCNGHGTHVASSIGGTKTGVAKAARLHGLKVFGCSGSGPSTAAISAIQHVIKEHKKDPKRKDVINMSLGGPMDPMMNRAVKMAIEAGIVVVAAAGNEFADACRVSPASSPDAITVAAADEYDGSADFSNYGKCVTLYAPGVEILGAWNEGKKSYNTISGTSMASPHVAGAVAAIMGKNIALSPADVKKYLVEQGTKSVIKGSVNGTPNVMLYLEPNAKQGSATAPEPQPEPVKEEPVQEEPIWGRQPPRRGGNGGHGGHGRGGYNQDMDDIHRRMREELERQLRDSMGDHYGSPSRGGDNFMDLIDRLFKGGH